MLHQNKNINFVTCNIQPPKYGFPSPGTFGANDICTQPQLYQKSCTRTKVSVALYFLILIFGLHVYTTRTHVNL